ncbi:MAG: LuxR C-terminal-related transcriptional regulator [Micromonosporaceae bacterium]
MADATRPAAADAGTDWRQAYEDLAGRKLDSLTLDELARLADAAFWVGRPRECVPARRRLYAAYRDTGDTARAAMTGWQLFNDHFDLDETAAAHGWLKRAERHAQQLPDSAEQGYVALGCAEWARYRGEQDAALEHARRAIEIGERTQDRDLEAHARAVGGRMLAACGDVSEGVELLDEAMLSAVGGELSPFTTGWVYCVLLHVCSELGDVRRATEWTDLAMRWSGHLREGGYFPGLCRLHRCEITSLRGGWAIAEAEALRAAQELAAFGGYLVAEGHYLVGEIRRLKGDLVGALDAFQRAHELGKDPQPGMALLRLAQGDARGASSALRVALTSAPSGFVARARLLAAQVAAELRLGNVAAARESVDQLAAVAAETGTPLLRAMSATSRGAVLLAENQVEQALPILRDACAIWRELSFPYEAAQTRMLLGDAIQRAGDEATARMEFEAARTAFQQLGATADAARAHAVLAGDAAPPGRLTEREVEVLRLVARGRSNRQIATELFISEHTVARHLSNIFRKIDVTSRAAATAYAFEHELV